MFQPCKKGSSGPGPASQSQEESSTSLPPCPTDIQRCVPNFPSQIAQGLPVDQTGFAHREVSHHDDLGYFKPAK